jgi:hypothetical protein
MTRAASLSRARVAPDEALRPCCFLSKKAGVPPPVIFSIGKSGDDTDEDRAGKHFESVKRDGENEAGARRRDASPSGANGG